MAVPHKKVNSSPFISAPSISSFFDDSTPVKSIWETAQNLQSLKIPFSTDGFFLLGLFFKKKKSLGSWVQKTYLINSDCMTYQKKDGSLGKFMIFDSIRVNFINEPSNMKNGSFKYGFNFLKNKNTCELLTNDKESFEEWKKALSARCILHTFHDEYQVSKMVGKGSFAKVFLAKKALLNQEYAIKAFSKESLTSQEKGRASLLNEINIMRKMDHKQIIKLYEVHETEHSLYLVLEPLTGGELVKKMKEKPYYGQDDVTRIMKNLLEALEHIHAKGIMHRDLKLENLLLRTEKDIDVVVVDFGLATTLGLPVKDILFKRCGTPGFVAPEVLSYKDGCEEFYDEKCDIFSAGVILFILLTGRKPFTGLDYKEILKANRDCKIDYEKEDIKKLNGTTFGFLKQLLAPLPVNRPSAQEALNHSFFLKLKTTIDPEKMFASQLKNLEEEKSQHFALKDYSLGKFSLGKNSMQDSVDALANDLFSNKPYNKSDKLVLTNLQTYSSNLSLDSPKRNSKFYKNDLEEADSPKKQSKFSSKNNEDELFPNDNLRKKSMASPSELHKLAIINNMKDKITDYGMEVPEENSPLQNSIKLYGSLEAKAKNI